MKKKNLPLSRVYRLMEPGPVVLVTTSYQGNANIMTMSWHTMMEFTPPIIGCVISNRNYSFELLRKTKVCAINIPTADLARKVVRCGNVSGRKVDKFAALKLTPMRASKIPVPLIDECYANLECRVVDTSLVNRYCFFVLEVLKAWIDSGNRRHPTIHHRGNGVFMVSGKTMTLPSKMK